MSPRRKVVIVFILLLVVSTLAWGIYALLRGNIQSDIEDDSSSSKYTDPYTNEVVYDQNSRVAEAEMADDIVFLGSSILLQNGLDFSQVEYIKLNLKEFSKVSTPSFKEVTLDPSSLVFYNNGNDEPSIHFTIIANRNESEKYVLSVDNINLSRPAIFIEDIDSEEELYSSELRFYF